ncbi:MAG TPA: hypothetical protein VGL89_13115 [Candidatus Koribacter sp.]
MVKRRTLEEIRAQRDPEEFKRELETLGQMKDEDIDFSDIPELTAEQIRGGVRGMFYNKLFDRKPK